MGYYESVLKNLPFNAFRLNSAENAYIDYTGRGYTITGTPAYTPSILAGSPKSLLVSGGSTLSFGTSVFSELDGDKPFSLAAWVAPLTSTGTIGILTHGTAYDGLVFDGDYIKFVVKSYLNNTVEATWPVPDSMESLYVVGTYSPEKIQLFINGLLAAEAAVPEEFAVGGFVDVTNSNLTIGASPVTTEKLVADGFATYPHILTPGAIFDQFLQGRGVVTMGDASLSTGAAMWDGVQRNVAMARTFSGESWLNGAIISEASVSDGYLKPLNDMTTLQSKAGTWTTAIPLEATESASIAGVKIEWDGDGTFVVETSFDNSTYTSVVNGRIATGTIGIDTAVNKTLFVRVSFAGGVVNDDSMVRRLSYYVYNDGLVVGTDTSRTMTISGNVATATEHNEPIERNLQAGLDFYGGEAVISIDATDTPRNVAAVELWVRMRSVSSGTEANIIRFGAGATNYLKVPVASGNIIYGGASAVYVNGTSVATNSTSIKYGEWNHIIYVPSSPLNDTITLGDLEFDGQIGMVSLLPAAPTAAEALELYRAYSKLPSSTITDASTITLSESASPFNMYNYAWDISAGG